MMGHFDIAWDTCRTLSQGPYFTDGIYHFIAFDVPFSSSEKLSSEWLSNIFGFIEHIRMSALDNTESEILDNEPTEVEEAQNDILTEEILEAYARLSQHFWYDASNAEQALLCCNKQMDTIKMTRMVNDDNLTPYFPDGFMFMADIYCEIDFQQAISFYERAISGYEEKYPFEQAKCISRIGFLRSVEQNQLHMGLFQRAFEYLVSHDRDYWYVSKLELISDCYFSLAKAHFSCYQDATDLEMALQLSQQALNLTLHAERIALDRDSDTIAAFLISIHSTMKGR